MSKGGKAESAFISVVIPVYNDPIGLITTLESLLDQDYPPDKYEILVIDNNSSDHTREVIEDFAARYPERVLLLVENNVQSSYAARNKGIRKARGELLAFLDSDMWADKNWFKVIAKTFKDKSVGYVGFNIKIHPSGKSLVGLYNSFTGFPIGTYMAESHFAGAGCIAVRKSVFKKIGPFDHKFISGGDAEFGDRCWRKGVGQLFVGGYLLHHPARESFKSLMKKEFRIGRGQRQLATHYPNRFSNRRFVVKVINFFLPPNPMKLLKTIKSSNLGKPSLKYFPVFYLIGLSAKIFRNLGYLYEWRNR